MNKTKGKKILSLVLTFCMVLSLLPSMAFAAADLSSKGISSITVGDTAVTITGDQEGNDLDNAIAGSVTIEASKKDSAKLAVTFAEEASSATVKYLVQTSKPGDKSALTGETTKGEDNKVFTSNEVLSSLQDGVNHLWIETDKDGVTETESPVYFDITVNVAPAAPQFTSTTATFASADAKDVTFGISGAPADSYKVYTVESGGEASSDPTASLEQNNMKLTFQTQPEETKQYYIAAVKNSVESTSRTQVTVNPYKAPTMTVSAVLNGGPLTQNAPISGATITLTADGTANFAAISGTPDGKYTLDGAGAAGITISQVTASGSDKTATLTLTGTPTATGAVQVKVAKNAFTPEAAADVTATGEITVGAAPEPAKTSPLTALTVSNGSEVTITPSDLGSDGAPVTLTSTLTAKEESFTITATVTGGTAKYSTEGMTQAAESGTDLNNEAPSAAIEFAGAETKDVYIYAQSTDQQTKAYYKLTVTNGTEAAKTVTLSGTTTLEEGTEGGNIVLTATDGTFASPATPSYFTLSDETLSVQSVEISQTTSEKDTATLTITGTPKTSGALTVTVKKEAFEPQAAENATATVQIKAKAEPAKTSPLTALTVSNGSEVTITPSDLGTQSGPVALTSTLNANAESFTITATFGEATAKYSTESMEQAESSEKSLTSGSASDAINTGCRRRHDCLHLCCRQRSADQGLLQADRHQSCQRGAGPDRYSAGSRQLRGNRSRGW